MSVNVVMTHCTHTCSTLPLHKHKVHVSQCQHSNCGTLLVHLQLHCPLLDSAVLLGLFLVSHSLCCTFLLNPSQPSIKGGACT